MDDSLGERIEELKQSLEDLRAKGATGQDLVELEALEAKLARLTLAYLVAELELEDAAYADAAKELDQAIATIDEANRDMTAVATAIRIAAKSVAVVEKVVAAIP